MIFADGSYYQGEFANNEIIGQGTRYFAATNSTYTGHFYYGTRKKFFSDTINNDSFLLKGEMDGHGRLRLARILNRINFNF